ncbi:MAG TPA: TadE/TadG family type IV pilus assembly protein [Terracidiphilus sp.]|nr:TadE/TadG family type IV pilus assembly protein [Terracidiphilus sp.]
MKIASRRSEQVKLKICDAGCATGINESECRRQSIVSRIRALIASHEEGTQLVELAFVAPIFLIMLTGIASFAMALYSYQQLGYATAATAQQVGAQQGLITDPCAQIATDVTTALPGWKAGSFTYTAVITDSGGSSHTYGPTTGSSFSCTAGAGNMAQNEPMTITVSYAYDWFSILAWGPNNTFSPSGNLTVSEAVMVE